MSLLAGIFSRHPKVPIYQSHCDAIKHAISRHPDDQAVVFRDPRVCLLKVDIGAYGEPAFRISPAGTVAMLAGEPLLRRDQDNNTEGRAQDLETLHQGWDEGDWGLLNEAQGTFCAVHYRPDTATLSFVADRLGVRPLYYWVGDSFVVFASALRILEALPYVPKRMDVRAVTEITGFGYPLGTRTPYCDIAVLREAEIVQISDDGIATQQYWRWDTIPVSSRPESELLKEVYERFMAAVARRLRSDTTTVALLSGGLDSRCVVAALCALKARVYTFNSSIPGSQDQAFAVEFARKIGTTHHEESVFLAERAFYRNISAAWRKSRDRERWPAERPMLIWSGDGGSVGLGHVYMTPNVVSLLRTGRLDAAVDEFLREEKHSVICRLLRRRMVPSLRGALHAGVREEFGNIHSSDRGRDLYIFLLLNDQRRHLSRFYEEIDLIRFEFQLPFFDSNFLASVIAVPLDLCLRHRFYTKWLSRFQPDVTQVPWQTYPGHEPCPLPIPKGLAYQWDRKAFSAWRAHEKRDLLRKSGEMLSADDFPHPILDGRYLRLVRLIYRLWLRDYGYVLRVALTYHQYWKACAGNYRLPAS